MIIDRNSIILYGVSEKLDSWKSLTIVTFTMVSIHFDATPKDMDIGNLLKTVFFTMVSIFFHDVPENNNTGSLLKDVFF